MLAVASPTQGNAAKFAKTHDIPHHFADDQEPLAMPEINMVVSGIAKSLSPPMNQRRQDAKWNFLQVRRKKPINL
jgi:hypothetical protein